MTLVRAMRTHAVEHLRIVDLPGQRPPGAREHQPTVQPRIQLNIATDRDDLRRLAEGVHLAWQIAHQTQIARHTHRVAQRMPDPGSTC